MLHLFKNQANMPLKKNVFLMCKKTHTQKKSQKSILSMCDLQRFYFKSLHIYASPEVCLNFSSNQHQPRVFD